MMVQPVVIGRHFNHLHGFPVVTFDVLYDGVEYRCDSHQLNRLYQGTDPVHLDLVKLPIEADDD